MERVFGRFLGQRCHFHERGRQPLGGFTDLQQRHVLKCGEALFRGLLVASTRFTNRGLRTRKLELEAPTC
jgi:hypothetical protein